MAKSISRQIIEIDSKNYHAGGKLKDKVAIVTGGDSGIGAASAVAFGKEGAKVVIIYLKDHKSANKTKDLVEANGGDCYLIAGDVGSDKFCRAAIKKIIKKYNKIDILVNNAGTQTQRYELKDITEKQLVETFRTNIYSMFFLTKYALEHMTKGATIINTTSVTAYRGSQDLIDYSATKGAITAFTRSLSQSLAKKQIRVNAVAPGPVWTDLIFDSFDKKKIASFGLDQPLGRAGQPYELAPAYVYLASSDSSYVSGQVLHVNGGEIVNG